MCIICCKISLVWRFFSAKISPEKRPWCFPFALRCCECDSWLPVHPRSSATPVFFFACTCVPLRGHGVCGHGVRVVRRVVRCSYLFLHVMHALSSCIKIIIMQLQDHEITQGMQCRMPATAMQMMQCTFTVCISTVFWKQHTCDSTCNAPTHTEKILARVLKHSAQTRLCLSEFCLLEVECALPSWHFIETIIYKTAFCADPPNTG